MTLTCCLRLYTHSGSRLSPALAQTKFRRCFSSTYVKEKELSGYQELIQSTERAKVKRIAEAHLLTDLPFSLNQDSFSAYNLVQMLVRIKQAKTIPIHQNMGEHTHASLEAIHFENNRTFINLPYSDITQKWSDRMALQTLIRNHFKKIYKEDDLAIIPGCTDGQVAIEIYAHSLANGVKLHDIVAADYNLPAMELGYITMDSFGLNPHRIQWLQSDITQSEFYHWLHRQYPSCTGRHQVATLVQPSLREVGLITFLTHCAAFARLRRISTTIVMPVLLADRESKWYQHCNQNVSLALKQAKVRNDVPTLMWNKTKFGIELLKLHRNKSSYVPQQYFVDATNLPEIMKQVDYREVSQEVFESITNPHDYTSIEDPRRQFPRNPDNPFPASRTFCIWSSNAV